MNNVPHPNHFVRFSDDEATLSAEVGAYLAEVRDGGTAIIISTPERLQAVQDLLRSTQNFPQNRLIALDAAATLRRFMVGNRPDPRLFDAVVGDVVRAAARQPGPVHAYGEMVSLLCAQGLYHAAIELEKLWNELARTVEFSLFCAYAWNLFPTVELADAFDQVCREHAHACSDQHPHKVDTSSTALRVLELERKALALDGEVARWRGASWPSRRPPCAPTTWPISSTTRPRASTASAPMAPSCGPTRPNSTCWATAGTNTSASTSPASTSTRR
ncbi:MAG TPA: MEDS domain-containing protein [Duganella sp.]|nr:MEDS domain-containing protein [Duganella sp.]